MVLSNYWMLLILSDDKKLNYKSFQPNLTKILCHMANLQIVNSPQWQKNRKGTI